MQNRKKILIISEAHLISRFVQAAVNRIKIETDTGFDCLVTSPIDENTRKSLKNIFENVFVNEFPKGIASQLPKIRSLQNIYGLRKLALKLPNYDIAHIHFHHYYYAFISPIIRKKATCLFLTFYGGDFHRISRLWHLHNQITVNLADGVFAENEVMLNHIDEKYKVRGRHKVIGKLIFLMEAFISFEAFLGNNNSESAKQTFHIRKKIIACGYSAGAIMQHSRIIDALEQIKSSLEDYIAVFPMTYGWRGGETRERVKKRLKSSEFDSLILEDYLPTDKLQALRLATDIFVNIPVRDQLSSSMLEHLAAGSVVITGKWLPYSDLTETGIFFIQIDSPEDLSSVLPEVFDHLEHYKEKAVNNRKIILRMMSWDSIKGNWFKYYDLHPIS